MEEIQVLDYFKKKTNLKKLDSNTNIASEDIGIYDLDAEHLMLTFFNDYEIDFKGFDISSYFYYPNYTWKDIFFIKPFIKNQYPKLKPLTISHLQKVAENKKWFNPDSMIL